MKRFFSKLIGALLISISIASFCYPQVTQAAPSIANYFLGPLPSDAKSWEYFGKSEVLIFTPDQIISHQTQISDIKKKNPKLVVLAYVPSQSYNTQYWKNDAIFRYLQVQDSWWLRNADGTIRSPWPGLALTNMTNGWSENLVGFTRDHIATIPNVDGIFFDMVMDGILGTDMNTVDLNGDGSPDGTQAAVSTWVGRTQYFLQYARANLPVKYLIMNGTSNPQLQANVNGRMFETFPTPWESGGNWSAIMTAINRNLGVNAKPALYILNSNSGNTGKQNDYRKVRFGLASSLMVDSTAFGYDYGDTAHNQVWWYDEYDAGIGNAVASAASVNNKPTFQNDVWRRDFDRGVALVNPTGVVQTIDLGGEYEKIIGTQDAKVNDGSIVDKVQLPPQDGLLMYKTFKTVNNTSFKNGTFVRFYRQNGTRARNGFFSTTDSYESGVKLYQGDVDADGVKDTIVIEGARVRFISSAGTVWYDGYPYGDAFDGEINMAVGRVLGSPQMQILLAPSVGGKLMLFNFNGELLLDNVFPLGTKYQKGLSVAFGNLDGSGKEQVIVATWPGVKGEIMIYDKNFEKIKTRFAPYGNAWKGGVKLTSGDFNGDGKDEIATLQGTGKTLAIRFFSSAGKKLNEFALKGFFGEQRFTLGAADVNNEGKDEVVVMSGN